MTPSFISSNPVKVLAVNPEFLCKDSAALSAGISFSNLNYLRLQKFGDATFFSSWHSVFRNGVRHIVGLCPRKHVIRVNARGIVAFVAKIKAIRYFSEHELEHHPVSQSALSISGHECAVSKSVSHAVPNPASISKLDLGNKLGKLWNDSALQGAKFIAFSFWNKIIEAPRTGLRFAFNSRNGLRRVFARPGAKLCCVLSCLEFCPALWTLFLDHKKSTLSCVREGVGVITGALNSSTLTILPSN